MRAARQAREAAASGPVAVAGSMSSFCPIAMDQGALGNPLSGLAAEDPRFPGPADFREQAGLLAEAGADLIALEMIEGRAMAAPPCRPPPRPGCRSGSASARPASMTAPSAPSPSWATVTASTTC